MIFATVLAVGLTTAALQSANAPDCIPNPDALMQADLNNDGVITLTEVRERRADTFARLDRNGDGVAEMADAPRRMGKERFTEVFTKVAAEFDANGDGRVTFEEFVSGPTPGFDRANTNGDDKLDSEELAGVQALACDAG